MNTPIPMLMSEVGSRYVIDKVWACVGGYRYNSPQRPAQTRVFLIPKAEYHEGSHLPFVIDPEKYEELDD